MLSQEEKIHRLEKLSRFNYANSVLFKLSRLSDLLNESINPKKKDMIDVAYQMVTSEVRSVGLSKPLISLSTLAFREEPNSKDYFIFVKESEKGNVSEIKELLTLPVDQPERRSVVDYLTFPLLAAMTRHLTTEEKTEIFLLRPSLILDHMGRDMTFREYLSEKDYCHLIENVPADVKNSIFHPYITPEETWN